MFMCASILLNIYILGHGMFLFTIHVCVGVCLRVKRSCVELLSMWFVSFNFCVYNYILFYRLYIIVGLNLIIFIII